VLVFVVASAVLAPAAFASGPELVTNGGFESPTVSAAHATSFDEFSVGSPSGFGWAITRNSVDLIAGYWDANSGSQSLDLDGNAPGEITQTLATTANTPYVLSFAYSANPDRFSVPGCSSTNPAASMTVWWGSHSLGTFTYSDSNSRPHGMAWKTASVQVDASLTGGPVLLKVTSNDTAPSACGIALDDFSVTPKSCDPGAGQVTLYTLTNYTGDCAVYSAGSYPDVANGGAGLPNNTAESIKVGTGAFAVLHGVPSFGGTFDNGWVNVDSSDPDLHDKVYRIPSNENHALNAFASVSALWVMGTGCTPGAHQVSVFASPGYGGGCVNIPTGQYADAISAGIPNDWVSSLKVGSRVEAKLYLDTPFGGGVCDYDSNAQATDVCGSIGDQQMSAIKVIDEATTAATLTLTLAASLPGGTAVAGSLQGQASTSYPLSFFQNAGTCSDDTNGTALGSTNVTTNASGAASFALVLPSSAAIPSKVSVTTRLPFFAPTSPAAPACLDATQGDSNTAWTTARQINLSNTNYGTGGVNDEALNNSGESRWYKFNVTPGGTVQIDLTGLPSNYDLFLFTDIGQAYNNITAPGGLQQVSAELGAQFSPAGFTPAGFTPAGFTPAGFTPAGFTPAGFTPAGFTPAGFTGSDLSPAGFTPAGFTPAGFTPAGFTPDEAAYESAQYRSLYGYSVNDGTASEHIFTNIFNYTGTFYIRVNGRNGAFAPGQNYSLSVNETPGPCGGVSPSASPAVPPGFVVPTTTAQTLILTDYGRLTNTFGNISALQAKVSALATATNGTVADVGVISPVVAALNAQADATGNLGCPYAKNLVAGAIKDIVAAYRAANPNLKSIVIVGDDHIIPFFRYPDTAGLGSELNYVPPVQSVSASQGSLQSNDVLSQDAYGSTRVLHVDGVDLPLPGLAVGRLVETPTEIITMINAYLGTANGVVPTPHSSLVTGYDFMASGANAAETDLVAGLGAGATNDTLISPQGTQPSASWTADQLRASLFGSHHDLIYFGAHFSANNLLAADDTTTVNALELGSSSVNLTNTLVLSGGCHSAYDIVNGDGIPGVTQTFDWTEAFAQKGATLIGGTGYQYGDTDFLAYSQKIDAGVVHALRYGTGPVSIGNALVQAKKDYLSSAQSLQGIDVKALLEATLYGIPGLSINLPAGRNVPQPNKPTVVTSTTQETTNPGLTLGLSYFDYTATPALTTNNVTLHDTNTNAAIQATYLSGPDGVVTSPLVPALPLQQVTVDDIDPHDSGKVLRGVGFLGGTYTDLNGVTPLTGAATTDLNASHSPFVSSIFFPSRLWTVNYFGGLTGNAGASTQLMITPAQYMSDGPLSITDTQRAYQSSTFRLYYSGNTQTYGSNVPALAAPPTISRVDASVSGGSAVFTAHVVGDPSAGIQEVWVTYTGLHAGKWEPLFLTQDATDSTLWTGSLALGAVDPSAIRFMVQAVNGVGVVSMDDNVGADYKVGGIAPALQTPLAPTSLALNSPPTTGAYGASVNVSATLSGATPLAGQTIRFSIGKSTRTAVTDGSGLATAQLPLTDNPGAYTLSAAFDGDANDKSSSASVAFTITKLPTSLSLTQNGYVVVGLDTYMVATLTSGGQPVSQKSVAFLFTPTGGGSTFAQTRITDGAGHATLGPVSTLPAGTYNVQAYFGPGGPAGVPALPSDPIYAASASSPAVPLTVNAINGAGIAGLTVFYVQTSARYLSSNASQRQAETTSVTTICNSFLQSLNAANKASRIAAFKNQLNALMNGGWLTSAQVAQLSALVDQL
jgi:hypothetical protein